MLQSGLTTFTAHTWVRGTFVAVATVTGQVGVFLRGEQKGCYQLMEHIPVICIAAHQAGFVTLSHAMLSFFAPTEPDHRYDMLYIAVVQLLQVLLEVLCQRGPLCAHSSSYTREYINFVDLSA